MAETRYIAKLNELRWLDLNQAKTYTHHYTTKSFMEEFGYLATTKGSGCRLWDKLDLDRHLERRKEGGLSFREFILFWYNKLFKCNEYENET